MKAVIIGNSAAGVAAASTLRSLRPDASITVLSREQKPGYSPSLLTHYIADEIAQKQVFLYPPRWYHSRNIDLRLNHEVMRIDLENKRLFFVGGAEMNYDTLLIASGASPVIPFPFQSGRERIRGIRTIADANRIRNWLKRYAGFVVIGGGFVGLKLSSCIRKKGKDVTVVEIAPRLLGDILDDEADLRLTSHLMSHGVRICCNTKVVAMEKQKNRYVLTLTDGTVLDTDAVVVAIGVRPNTDFLDGSVLEKTGAIQVDMFQETLIPDVYAAGDACLSKDIQSGEAAYHPIWPNAVRQGKVAAFNMAGIRTAFPGSIAMNSGEFMDMWLNIVGTTQEHDAEPGSLIFSNERCYQRLYLKGSRIIKYIAVGNIDHTGVITQAICSRTPIDELARVYPANQIPVITRYQTKGISEWKAH